MKMSNREKALSALPDKASYQQKTSITSNRSVLQRNTKFKKRNWACVVYPESLLKNWLDVLQKTGLKIAISPLHDKDLEADGKTHKKAHYHVILVYNGPTSYNVVKSLTKQLNAPSPIALEAVRGYYRYFTHKDNPEKYQYDEKEIRCLNGFNVLDFIELTNSEVQTIIKDLHQLIIDKQFIEYSDFMEHLLRKSSDNEYSIASSHTIFFTAIIKGIWRKQQSIQNIAGLAEKFTNES